MATGQLEAIIEPALVALGYELVGIEYLGQGRHSLLRVYIDSDNGITVDDCELASRQISAVLDVEDPIRGQYTLEVSSPGLERPLFKAEHYERFKGNSVQIRLRTAVDGRRKYVGELQGMRGEDVLVTVDGQERAFPLQDIEKANLKADW